MVMIMQCSPFLWELLIQLDSEGGGVLKVVHILKTATNRVSGFDSRFVIVFAISDLFKNMAQFIKVPDDAVVENILAVYVRGLTVDALRRAETFAPLAHWGGVAQATLAARIAINAGAPRLAMRLSVRAWHTDRNHPSARIQFGYQLLERRGPLAAWRAMRQWQPLPSAEKEPQAELLGLEARVATELRDFAAAEKILGRAEELDGNDAWIRLQRAHLLEKQDRVEEALDIARAATALHPYPHYRPGVQIVAHLLQLLDRDAAAVELLQQADGSLQSGPVAGQLYGILSENGRWAEAGAALSRYLEMSPLLEPPLRKWVTSQRARVAYHLGRRPEALGFAREVDDEFHKMFARNLELPAVEGERRQLDVSFVRQHFKTCAPATMAALGRYWQLPAEHLKLAEAMCYDGTPHWQQREWAEQNGWFVREFRVAPKSVSALINRGIPFAISTVQATSAHMQAVVGFDQVRGTILLRDPGQPYLIELFAESFFKFQRPFGPHGTVFIPLAERDRVETLELPDARIYDDQYRFSLCLNRHDRAGAEKILADMVAAHGEHELVCEAHLFLAGYDANVSGQLRWLDKLLELFPNNPARLFRRLGCLRNASRSERIEFLEQISRAPEPCPVFFVELARTLAEDARCESAAGHWLKRAQQFYPCDANAITVQANLLWAAGNLDEATELYRFAANLESYRENHYQTWFSACRRTRRADEALAILADRFKRFGHRSEDPGLTLAWAWRELNQLQRAREVYDEACRLRPEDGSLLLKAASLGARLHNAEATEKYLNAARDRVRRSDWLRAKAEIALFKMDVPGRLQICRDILELEPLALDAHEGIARALAQREGTAAALAHLKSACARFPHHYGLQRMLLEWRHEMPVPEAEAAARELLRIDPADAWARRELALILARDNRLEEAFKEASEAAQIEPRNSFSFSVLGHLQVQRRENTEARTSFRRAAELSVDNGEALRALLDLAQTDRERKDELAFIEGQLVRQVVTGDGLLAFNDLAGPILEPEALLHSLRLAHQERPDLWHAWSALVAQLGHLKRLDEALEFARQAADRFPYLPRIWLDLAQVHQWRKETEPELAAARRSMEISPAWNRPPILLAGTLERLGRFEEAGTVYETALQYSPGDAQLNACHAYLLWRQRQPEAAFAKIETALRISPGYEWPWNLLQDWAGERGESRRAGDFARTLAAEHAGEYRVWLMLARVLTGAGALPERLAALDRALALDPGATEAWDIKAELLAQHEQFDEAVQTVTAGLAASHSEVHILRGRRAWVEARRGRRPEAIRLMREVLQENASYVWGWSQLAHWLLEQGAMADASAALETLQRLRPHDSWVSRQLGFLKLKQGDQPAARQAFAAALQISPTDVHAAQKLFDLQLNAADLPGAAQTLAIMQKHQPGTVTQSAEIFLALRKNDRSAVQLMLEKLCLAVDPDPWPLDAAADACRRAGLGRMAIKVYRHALKSDACHPQVAAAAVRQLVAVGDTLAAVWLFLRLKPGELQRRSAAPLVNSLADAKARIAFVWLYWRRRPVLHADDAAWGQVGYALSNFKWSEKATLWLSDWRSRQNVEPWMLFNLCYGLRQLGDYAEATVVARYAIDKWGHRDGSADLRLFLAVEDALAGEVAGAREHLQQVSIREKVAYDQDLLVLARTLVDFQQSPVADRLRQFEGLKVELGKRFNHRRMLSVMKDVRRTFRRAGVVFARQGGGWRARLWFGWKLNWQWSLLPLTPCFLALLFQPVVAIPLVFIFAFRFIRSK